MTRDMRMGLKTLILGVDTKEVAQLDCAISRCNGF